MRILGLKKIHQAQKQEMNRCEALFSWAMPNYLVGSHWIAVFVSCICVDYGGIRQIARTFQHTFKHLNFRTRMEYSTINHKFETEEQCILIKRCYDIV